MERKKGGLLILVEGMTARKPSGKKEKGGENAAQGKRWGGGD